MRTRFSLLLWLTAALAVASIGRSHVVADEAVAELVRVPACSQVQPRSADHGYLKSHSFGYEHSFGYTRNSHTPSVVQVFAQRGAGCGTLIEIDGAQGKILTAAHVIERTTTCRIVWESGATTTARVVAADQVLDVALLIGEVPQTAVAIPLAGENEWPTSGDVVELIGYGGGRLRHWQASVNGYAPTLGTGLHQTLSVDTQTIGGDSGGAMLFRGKLVGVIWGGPLAGPLGPMTATHGTCCVAIAKFLEKHSPRDPLIAPPDEIAINFPPCRGGNCPLPRTCPPNLAPPRSPQPAPQPGPAPKPAPIPTELVREIERLSTEIARLEKQIAELHQPTPIEIDLGSLVAALTEHMAKDDRFRGPPGKNGRDGANGKDGVDGKNIASTSPDLDELANQVKARLAGSIRVRVEPVVK